MPERVSRTEPRVYVSNHVSWFEIFALATVVDRYRFVAKKEIRRVPLFGRAAGAVAAIYIERDNRKAAFSAYEEAAKRIKGGLNVVVFPEGTRGRSYELRPFKKGPFVLAIAAQVPIVPVMTWGSREVQAKGEDRDTFRDDRAHLSRAGRDEGTDVRGSRRARRDRVESHRRRAGREGRRRFTDRPQQKQPQHKPSDRTSTE